MIESVFWLLIIFILNIRIIYFYHFITYPNMCLYVFFI